MNVCGTKYSVLRKNNEQTVDKWGITLHFCQKKYLQWVAVGSMLSSVGKSG